MKMMARPLVAVNVLTFLFYQTGSLRLQLHPRPSQERLGAARLGSAQSILHLSSGLHPHLDHDRVLLLCRNDFRHVGSRHHHFHHPDATGYYSILFCLFFK